MLTTIKGRLACANTLLISLLLGLTLFLALNIYLPQYQRAEGLIKVNEISNLIIKAAGQQAIERGVTNGALSQARQQGRADSSLINQIRMRREAGDQAILSAFEKAGQLTAAPWLPDAFHTRLHESKQHWQAFLAARRQADRVMQSGQGSITNQEWLRTATRMILTNAQLRQAAFLPTTNAEIASYNNQVIKQAAWLAAEYAGRERAKVAAAIASGKPMPIDTRQALLGYRAIVDSQMNVLRHYNTAAQHNSQEFPQAWREVEQNFLGSYQQLRDTIRNSQQSGSYPVDVSQWLQRSTSAIDTLLALGDAASSNTIVAANRDVTSSQSALIFSSVLIASIAVLAVLLWLVITSIVRRLNQLESDIHEIENNNDLTVRLDTHNQDELSNIGRALNSMFSRFHNDLNHLHTIATQVNESAQQMATRSTRSRTHTEQQYDRILAVSGAMEQMQSAVAEVAEATSNTASMTDQAEHHAVNSNSVISSSVSTIASVASEIQQSGEFIQKLEKQTNEISAILNVISGIAEQTNLLALNAAIEAARAGDQGRGFAVVADEVRQLAHDTQQSTENIETMIHTLQNSANLAVQTMSRSTEGASEGVEQSRQASEALTDIARLMSDINQMSSRIAASTEQQSQTTAEISTNMQTINSLAGENSEDISQTEQASQELKDLAERMHSMIGKFQL